MALHVLLVLLILRVLGAIKRQGSTATVSIGCSDAR